MLHRISVTRTRAENCDGLGGDVGGMCGPVGQVAAEVTEFDVEPDQLGSGPRRSGGQGGRGEGVAPQGGVAPPCDLDRLGDDATGRLGDLGGRSRAAGCFDPGSRKTNDLAAGVDVDAGRRRVGA